MLYVEGPLGSGKTSRLIQETADLLDQNPASSVLVLCSNHSRQRKFIERLLTRRETPLAQLPVYTFAGFVRNALFNFWPLVEQEIVTTLKRGNSCIRPELSGLEDSELILRCLLERLRAESALKNQSVFEDFPGTDQHILKQVVRRLRLRSENQLTRKDMLERSVLLEEMCRPEVAWLEKQFDIESYTLRVLDPNKQIDIFVSLLKKNLVFSQALRSEIRHLIVDDLDETIVSQQRFVEFLAPGLETLILAADLDGGSRRGYLNAYPYDWDALKRLRAGQTVPLTRQDPSFTAAQILLSNWKQSEKFNPLPATVSLQDHFINRMEMLEQVVEDIQRWMELGYDAGDFCLILPKTDFLSFHQLQIRLNQRGIPVQLLSGTKRPSDNPKCKAFISLLQWANAAEWKTYPSHWEVKTILMQAFQFHHLPGFLGEKLDSLARAIHDWLGQNSIGFYPLPPEETLPFELTGVALVRYQSLAQWLQKAANLSFDQQLYSAFKDILAHYSSERDAYTDLNRMIQSYLRQKQIYLGLTAGAKQTSSSQENPQILTGNQNFARWWLEQVKSGTMVDTPEMPESVNPEALIIATPQKVIDMELYRKIQCWLDVASREWARSDNAPLYNAWVHSAVWDGSSTAFSESFNEEVIRTRAGHITRTLMLLATERVHAYASELDELGMAHAGLLKPRLANASDDPSDAMVERAILRADQLPILAYRSGTLAISAVPGAGKTFVNVELLLEIIERGVEPDQILVLTYMDSAARTLLSRLKKKLAGRSAKLPVVSTIHSLAFRILTENDHALLSGFSPDDMTILDDYARGEILNRVAMATQPESTKNIGDWQRAIERAVNHVKMFAISEATISEQIRRMPGNFRLTEFLPALRLYYQELHRNGFLDFTDLITQAVSILRNHSDVRERYQRQFRYIIEDEAQDSSRLLQSFIQLLGGDTPNLIRTGDTNQSITTTFSSADTQVFRNFIETADQVVPMTQSGRCAPGIIDLANHWMNAAGTLPGLEQAFVPVAMMPVLEQNPLLLYPPAAMLFDMDRMEEDWLLSQIQTIRQKQPDVSIAILLRTNAQVKRVTAMLQEAKVPAVSLSDQLNTSPIFTLILTSLKLIATPDDLALQSQWYQGLVNAQVILENESRKAFLESHSLLHHSPLELSDELLRQWYYDFHDFSRQAAGGNISALIARIADQFCLSVADRSNGYLCALMAQDILNTYQHMIHLSPLETVIHQFETFQKSWRGKKSFSDVLSQHAGQVVQVMSVHKSKGQEFDIVFMPFLQTDVYPHEVDSIRFDESDKLIQELDRLQLVRQDLAVPAAESQAYDPQAYEQAKKREKIEEEARLIYVGLTRARRALFLTAHRQSLTRYNKLRKQTPAMAFQILDERINGPKAALNNVVSISEARNAKAP